MRKLYIQHAFALRIANFHLGRSKRLMGRAYGSGKGIGEYSRD